MHRASLSFFLLRDLALAHHSPSLTKLPIHRLPPPRSEPPHRPNDHATRHRNDSHPREQPAVANGTDERLRNDGSHTGEDVPHEIIHRDAVGRLFGHKLRQHGRRHGEDEHGADAEEEVCDQGHEPENSLFGRPAVPDEGGGVEERGDPGVLPHSVLGSVHQFALFVVTACTLGLSGHDPIRPSATEEGSEDIADGVGNVCYADENGGEVVGRLREGRLERNVEEIQRAESDAGVVNGD